MSSLVFFNMSFHNTEFEILHQKVDEEGWLALVGITGLLAFIAVALLTHLFSFHVYLSKCPTFYLALTPLVQ